MPMTATLWSQYSDRWVSIRREPLWHDPMEGVATWLATHWPTYSLGNRLMGWLMRRQDRLPTYKLAVDPAEYEKIVQWLDDSCTCRRCRREPRP